MEVDVDGVQADDKVDEGVEALGTRHVAQELRLDLVARGELAADGDEERERLGVDVADVDTALVGEEDHVALADRVDADVVLRVGRVRAEGLDDKVGQGARRLLDLFVSACASTGVSNELSSANKVAQRK